MQFISPCAGGAAFTLQAAPLPAMPDPSLPVSHFITQVNADKSITYRLFAPDAGGSR
ncbi:putative xylanase [Klebsiella pneumoniae]|uniref:Putative xylanase n=1 Tax=Klebsiella pneumoniae TaxID=573 RepID=A0A2X3CLT1_KLEPN|nr:putative xylanase [Klebsiella pneumoniae]